MRRFLRVVGHETALLVPGGEGAPTLTASLAMRRLAISGAAVRNSAS
jgi:hypothetical protein